VNFAVELDLVAHAVLVEVDHTTPASLQRTTMEAQVEDVVLGAGQVQGTLVPVPRKRYRLDEFVDLPIDDRGWPVPTDGLARNA
jgi:hypothetical protein